MTEAGVIDTELAKYSGALADTVAAAGPSIVGVDDGTRLTATGVVWAPGVIVATSHGVEQDEELWIVSGKGERLAATLVGRDHESDIAVLRVEGAGLEPIKSLPGGTEPRVGELALALARPGSEAVLSATLGIISARHDTETAGAPEYVLYTDAVLYPGFSGGALVAAGSGHFLGLLDRLYGRGMGVALGAPLVARVVDTLLKFGRVPRGYLGVRTQAVVLPESLRASLHLSQTQGLLVASVEVGSAAESAGLLLGDTLLAIDGVAVADVQDLRSHLRGGVEIALNVLRGGALVMVSATVGTERP